MLALDRWIRAWVVAHRVGVLDPAMWTLSLLGRGGMVWLGVGGVIAIRRRRRGLFTRLLLAVLLAGALTDDVLKPLVHRERPFVALGDSAGAVIGGRPDSASFPSGHSANAFAAALVLSRLARPAAAVWWGLAAAIAYSRVYLGVHYPLDVIGGAFIGLLCGWVAMALAPPHDQVGN